jgi:LmbE family N-acetylglucosaminyl deacetylase
MPSVNQQHHGGHLADRRAPAVPSAMAGNTGATMNIVAHEDDDLLFQSPTLLELVQSGDPVRTVYLTAGDAGEEEGYWLGREDGVRAAYANMLGVPDDWSTEDAGIPDHPIPVSTLVDAPQVSLAFLRLPDGSLNGEGFERNDWESLQKLYAEAIDEIYAIDGSSSYTWDAVIDTLVALMTEYQPGLINTLDFTEAYGNGDHSDHLTAAYLALFAEQAYATPHGFAGHQAYGIADRPSNVFDSDLSGKIDAFLEYAQHDYRTCSTAAACAPRPEHQWFSRMYTVGTPEPRPDSSAEPGTPTNIARFAQVTASSENTATGQTASRAVDGIVDGFPGDHTKEWASDGGGAGTTLMLSWDEPQTVSSVRLHDRPNADDHITGGTLTFSDGSIVDVPALEDDGGPTIVDFPARDTTSIEFTVTSVTDSTQNIGLAEFVVIGIPAADADRAIPAPPDGPLERAVSPEAQPTPGSSAADAAAAIGRSPVVDASRPFGLDALAVPMTLGTAAVVLIRGETLQARAVSTSTSGARVDEAVRVLRIDVEFAWEAGTADYEWTDFVLQAADGTVYGAHENPDARDDDPSPSGGNLGEGDTIRRALFFAVPADAAALSVALRGADGTPVATWSLGAH